MALDAGVNLIDTADVYSAGLSEEIVGKALPAPRDEVLIATKVRMPMGDGPNDAGLSRHHIVRGCEASLRRLGTDYIDLYQVHEWDGQTPLEETLAALDAAGRSGKVRYIGASNYCGWQLMKALGVSERNGHERVRQPADLLLAAGARRRERARPAHRRPGPRDPGVEPARRRPALRASTVATPSPTGRRHLEDWAEPPVHDEDKLYDTIDALVEIGGGARRLRRAGRARLAPRPSPASPR